MKTSTNLVPGKELSRSSLGFQETASKLSLKEINPYTVVVKKNVCKTELLSIEYKALLETKHVTQTFDCSDEYVNYAARNVTSLGLAFLYDSVTGFSLLKERCRKNKPLYQIETAETPGTIKREVYDDKTTVCKDIPVADAEVTANIKGNVVAITTSAKGIASLPPQKLAELQSVVTKSAITYHYDTADLTTEFFPKKRENPNLTKLAAVNSSLGENVENRANDSDDMALLDQEGAMRKKSDQALSPPGTDPANYKNRLAGGVNAVPAATKSPQVETDMMARLDQESAMKKGASKKAGNADPSLQPNRIARDVNSVVAGSSAAQGPETQSMAKIDDENAAMKKRSTAETAPDESAAKQNKLALAGSTLVTDPPVVADKPVVVAVKPAVVVEPTKPVLTVRFDSNKAVVKKEYRAELQKIAAEMKTNPLLITVIEGHTDSIGSAEVNRRMSLKRAGVIRDYFVRQHGIPKERIQVKGYGLTQPIADNGTEQGRAVNRRTEILINIQPSGV